MRRLTDLRKWNSIPGIVARLSLILCIVTFGASVWLAFPIRADTKPDPSVDMAVRLAEAKAKADSLEARVATLQMLLALLAGTGTVYGVAVGVSTYMNLKDTQDKAQASLDRVLVAETAIAAKYPAIGLLDQKIKLEYQAMRAFPSLKRLLTHLNPKVFPGLSPSEREEILLRESTFHVLTVFDYEKDPAQQKAAAGGFEVFGCFYAAWFLHEPQTVSTFERAMNYLNKALENDETKEITVNTTRGVLCSWRSDTSDPTLRAKMLQEADRNYKAVLDKQELHVRALVGAAYVADQQNRTSDAIEGLNKVFKGRFEDDPEAFEMAHYNRACYLAKSGKLDTAMADLWDLRRLARRAGTFDTWLQSLDEDAHKDLAALQGPYAAELAQFKDKNYDPS